MFQPGKPVYHPAYPPKQLPPVPYETALRRGAVGAPPATRGPSARYRNPHQLVPRKPYQVAPNPVGSYQPFTRPQQVRWEYNQTPQPRQLRNAGVRPRPLGPNQHPTGAPTPYDTTGLSGFSPYA